MWELTLLGLFLGTFLVLSLAISRNPVLRTVGLAVLLVVSAGGLVVTLGLLGMAVQTPRSDGVGRYGLIFLSIPAGLLTWLAFTFFRVCRSFDPHSVPQSVGLAELSAVVARRFGRSRTGVEQAVAGEEKSVEGP